MEKQIYFRGRIVLLAENPSGLPRLLAALYRAKHAVQILAKVESVHGKIQTNV